MKHKGQAFWITFILIGLLFGIGRRPDMPVVLAADLPGAMSGDLDVCGRGTGTGRITGRVTRADNGQPIRFTEIEVKSVYGDRIESSLEEVLTNSNGEYEFPELAGGTYVVSAIPRGVNLENVDGPILFSSVYDGQQSPATFTPVQVVDGQTTSGIDFALEEGARMIGRVTDRESGEALRGTVHIYKGDSESSWIASAYVAPDDNGYYTTTVGLRPGEYKLEFIAQGFRHERIFHDNADSFATAAKISITSPETVVINMALSLTPLETEPVEMGEIRGRVTYADSSISADFHLIHVLEAENGLIVYTERILNEQGFYSFTVPVGEYKLYTLPTIRDRDEERYKKVYYGGADNYAEADSVTVTANGVVDNVDFVLEEGGQIAGRVTLADSGDGVRFASVSAFPGAFHDYLEQSVSTSADASGYFTLPALANGVYTVTVDANGCEYPRQKAAEPIVISGPGVVSGANIAMTRGAFITGRVTISGTGAGVQIPIRALQDTDSEDEVDSGYSFSSTETGYYRAGPLLPGEYQLYFVPGAITHLQPLFYKETTQRADAQIIALNIDEVISDINVALAEAPDDPNEPGDGGSLFLPALKVSNTK